MRKERSLDCVLSCSVLLCHTHLKTKQQIQLTARSKEIHKNSATPASSLLNIHLAEKIRIHKVDIYPFSGTQKDSKCPYTNRSSGINNSFASFFHSLPKNQLQLLRFLQSHI